MQSSTPSPAKNAEAGALPDMAGRFDDLVDRTVFVSGGATGIGSVIVAALAGQGAHVHFCDLNEDAGTRLVEALRPHARNEPAFRVTDVTDLDALKAAVDEAAAATGSLYALVNNAANDTRTEVNAVDADAWARTVDVNLRHQFFAAQAAYPHLVAGGGGAIVNFGSIAPTLGELGLSVYASCKAAVFGLTRTLAREFGRDNIRVNSVVPGAILTPRQLELWITPEKIDAILDRQCLKRQMREDDIAEMVLFLCSRASRGCTGQEFRVDGGNF